MKIAILGCGNMARAFFSGAKDVLRQDQIFTYTPSFTRADELAKIINAMAIKSIDDLPVCDLVFIACKPQQFPDLSKKLSLNSKSVVISLMAGVTMEVISNALSTTQIIRTMPNTPSQVGEGVTLWCKSENIEKEKLEKTMEILSSVSYTHQVAGDDEIDFLTGFTGSGPAYIFEWARIMIEKMSDKNIDASKAKKIIGHTFLGASKLLLDSQETAKELRNNVTSPKGVTYEALKVFEKRSMQDIINEALDKAYERALELSKE
ncbi:MAG: pyrroline-5-carboxylate reductase [Bdellovibrionales bacterium]|jgi:pyrroline-5-carboxylate reductase|nr:pyrroline-5-carboxylate reductase [Bdellovibrionales bacterium]